MYPTKIKRVVRLFVLLTVVSLALQPQSVARAVDNPNGPELPSQCGSIQVEAGNKLAFHVYAKGVQIYIWNGTAWIFDAPRAALFAEANFFGEVGTHYRGPNWESKSGSRVKAIRVPGTGCTPDPTAIPWLLLVSTETTGPRHFQRDYLHSTGEHHRRDCAYRSRLIHRRSERGALHGRVLLLPRE